VANETPRRIVGPIGGASNNSAFIDQPFKFAPIGTIENVQVIAPVSKRPRFGRRAAVVKKFGTQLAGGLPVQTGVSLARASGTAGYDKSNCAVASSYVNANLPAFAGMIWLLDPNTSMYRRIKDLSTQTAGDNVIGAFVISWHPTEAKVIVGILCTKTPAHTVYYTIVSCYNTMGERLWQTILDDRSTPAGTPGTLNIIPNEIHVGTLYTYVPCGPYVYVLDTAAGTFHTRYDAGGGWFDEAMQVLETDVSGGAGKLWVLGMGSATTNAVVTTAANVQGWFFRSGVSRFTVGASPTGFTRDNLTLELEAGTNHGTYRLSSLLGRRPRGAIPYAFARLSNGDFVIGFTNRGWNADGTLAPSSLSPPTTIARLTLGTLNGTLIWEADTDSRLDPHIVAAGPSPGTYYNDIPDGTPGNNTSVVDNVYGPGGPEPSINAIAVDASDNIYCGGRRNQTSATAGENLFSFTQHGEPRWKTRLSGMIHQHCIKVDPTDGHIWVGGFRNLNWDGSGSATYAHLWKVNSSTGAVLMSQDLATASVHCYGLSVNSSGQVAYVSDTI